MFGWLNTIKEKSKELVQLYSNELSTMADQLDEDIKTLKSKIKDQECLQCLKYFELANLKGESEKPQKQFQEEVELNQNTTNNQEQTTASIVVSKSEEKQEQMNQLLGLLEHFHKSIKTNLSNQQFLREQIEFVEQNLDNYFSKDPKQLIMVERDDFTNFLVFLDVPGIEQYANKLQQIGIISGLPTVKIVLLRVLYFLIYQFHEKILYESDEEGKEKNSHKEAQEHEAEEEDSDKVFVKENQIQNSKPSENGSEHNQMEIKTQNAQEILKPQEDDNWEIDEDLMVI